MRTIRSLVLALGLSSASGLTPCIAGDPANQPPIATPALSATITDAITARVQQEIDAQNIVGISIALVRDGRIVHTQHFGWEDRENEIPASDSTMYRWASISKPLTAIVAMQLWQEGRIDLDADVRLLVPEFPQPAEQQVVTPRQLLCHQGGIVHYTNGPVLKTPRPDLNSRYFDIIDALDTFKASPLVCTPGEKYSYTTHGYILLGAAVQRGGNQPYPDQVRERIILPLGMTTLRPDYQWEEISNRAVGYRPAPAARRAGGEESSEDQRAVRMIRSTDTDVSWKLAGGGWISNITDLALLGAGMLSHQLVSGETRELMWERQKTSDGRPTSYGLGFQIAHLDGQRLISHSGSQEKARTLLTMLPDQNAAVAIMCNTEGSNLFPLGRDLMRLIAGIPEPKAAAP